MSLFPMLKTIMAGLFGKASTLNYPISPKKTFETTRGRMEVEIGSCVFCGLCSRKCPTGAIEVDRSEKTWSIARYGCIQCNACAEACPKKCLRMDRTPPDVMTEQEKQVYRAAGG